MTRLIYVLILVAFAGQINAQERWTLIQCIDYAIKNNISVKQADVQFRLSKITANQSRSTRYPTLGGSLNGSYQRGLSENPTTGTLEDQSFVSGSANLQSGYTLFNWNVRKNTILANNLNAKADEIGVDKAKNDISLAIANAYLQIMLRREQARISEVQMGQSRSQLQNIRKLVEAGSQPELNAIQVEAQLAKDSSTLLGAQALIQQAIINLKAYMNIDFATPFDISSPNINLIPVDNITDLQPESVYNIALTTQPTQRMYKLRIESGKYQISAARGSMYPDLSAFIGLNTRAINSRFPIGTITPASETGAFVLVGGNQYEVLAPSFKQTGEAGVPFFKQVRTNFGQQFGLSLNFPIFNNYNARSQWERAKLNVSQLQLQNDQENLNLKANIYNAYQDAYAALQKFNASKRTVEYSQKAYDISKKRYDIGLLGTLDFIITQNNLYLAQIDSISSQYDYIFKMKVLEFYKGQGIKL